MRRPLPAGLGIGVEWRRKMFRPGLQPGDVYASPPYSCARAIKGYLERRYSVTCGS